MPVSYVRVRLRVRPRVRVRVRVVVGVRVRVRVRVSIGLAVQVRVPPSCVELRAHRLRLAGDVHVVRVEVEVALALTTVPGWAALVHAAQPAGLEGGGHVLPELGQGLVDEPVRPLPCRLHGAMGEVGSAQHNERAVLRDAEAPEARPREEA